MCKGKPVSTVTGTDIAYTLDNKNHSQHAGTCIICSLISAYVTPLLLERTSPSNVHNLNKNYQKEKLQKLCIIVKYQS